MYLRVALKIVVGWINKIDNALLEANGWFLLIFATNFGRISPNEDCFKNRTSYFCSGNIKDNEPYVGFV